jgi:hypothetical protein
MWKLAGILSILTAILMAADFIHGPHNGDIYRTYIHVPEFIDFCSLLCLLEILAFRKVTLKFNLNRWLTLIPFAILSGIASLILFGLSGGSFHGDGGPITTSFLALSTIAEIGVPVALVGFCVSALLRKNAGSPIVRR